MSGGIDDGYSNGVGHSDKHWGESIPERISKLQEELDSILIDELAKIHIKAYNDLAAIRVESRPKTQAEIWSNSWEKRYKK